MAPKKRSFVRPLSFALAAVGFIGFWGATLWFAWTMDQPGRRDAVELIAGLVLLLAMAAHAVGVGIVFAAPRGERLLPALVNGLSLAIQGAVVAVGLTAGPG